MIITTANLYFNSNIYCYRSKARMICK